MQKAYEEIIEFIARGTTPNNVVAVRHCFIQPTRIEYN